MGKITRSGKALVRRMLVEVIWIAKAPAQSFLKKYDKIAERRGGKRVAVKLDRKILVMCRRMLPDETPFDPTRLAS